MDIKDDGKLSVPVNIERKHINIMYRGDGKSNVPENIKRIINDIESYDSGRKRSREENLQQEQVSSL